MVACAGSIEEASQVEACQLISQFFCNGHNLRPTQNDEVVERFLMLCGHVNFLGADCNQDIIDYAKTLYGINAMIAPGELAPGVKPLTTSAQPSTIATRLNDPKAQLEEDTHKFDVKYMKNMYIRVGLSGDPRGPQGDPN